MRKQIRGLTQASLNAEDGISAVQTAEGALTEVHDMLQRMNELAVKAANGTNAEDDRSYIQDEIDQLSQEIDRVSETTKFNETYLLKGDTKNSDAMGYSISYKTGYSVNGEAKFATTTSTGLTLNTVNLTAPDGTNVTTSEANSLLKALRDQGVTISSYTYGDGTSIASALALNGSEANSLFKVVAASDGANNTSFNVQNSKGYTVATLTITTAPTKAGLTQIVSAYTVTATQSDADTLTLYDASGNAISANNLDKYFVATGNGKAGTAGTVKAIAGAPKVYDALGKEVKPTDFTTNYLSAIKDLTAGQQIQFQVGADGTTNNKINITIDAMSAKGLGINGLKVDGTDGTNATNAIETIAAAITKVSTQRSALGAIQNRLEHTIKNLDNIVENTTSAESQIRDTDMATEMVTYSNANILSQAGQAMLAQSNQSNQGVLSLLG
jgi:flagellin